MLRVNYLLDHVYAYDPELDIDEFIVCSTPTRSGGCTVGHSVHNDFRSAKLAQMRVFLDKGIYAWIEHFPRSGPPNIEEQLDAEVMLSRSRSAT